MTQDVDRDHSEEDPDDPAAAFDALRLAVETQGANLARELAALRRGIEMTGCRVQEIGSAPDYGVDIARIVDSLGQVAGQLQTIQQSQDVVGAAADQYVAKFQESGTVMLRAALLAFQERSGELERVSKELGEQGRYVRLKFLGLAGAGGVAIGVVAGVLMTLFLPRFLPGSTAMDAASTVMGKNRWDAGTDLMQTGDPKKWNDFMYADSVIWANKNTLAGCRDAAAKAKKKQPCLFVISGDGED
jgi:Family of unknown function (DUF6118)